MKKKIYYTTSALVIGVGVTIGASVPQQYNIPVYSKPDVRIWEVQSIDTMKTSRDRAREYSGNNEAIVAQVAAVAETGATHIAIGTPYDTEFDALRTAWVTAAREQGLNVWFRGNWSGWEEWFEYTSITRRDHVVRTQFFIREHPEFFENGDIFEPCPECENGGPGDPRFTGDIVGHRTFIKELYTLSALEFEKLEKDITILFAMNGDVARETMDKETTEVLGGFVSIDHYVATGERLSTDATRLAAQSDGTIVLSEYGAPIPDIHGSFTEEEQAVWIQGSLTEVAGNRNIMGINYWVDRGGSTALWDDKGAAKEARDVLADFFSPYTVYGIVVDALGLPVEEVLVETPYGSVETDSEGYFQLPGLTDIAGLSVAKDKYVAQDIDVSRLTAEQQLTIVLERENESLFFKLQKALQQ